MPFFDHDKLQFHYRDNGAGIPFVFQHGLGSDTSQPFELFQATKCVRLLAFDCRGHGATRPLGVEASLNIESFADDLLAFLDHARITAAVVGGTSMGAAIAINFALRHPDRVLGLVLSRPAWLDRVLPDNLRVLQTITQLIREHGAMGGQIFQQTEEYRELLRQSHASANSVCNLFQLPRLLDTARVIEAVLASRPCASLNDLCTINVPTMILGNRHDPLHPLDYAVQLATYIPQSELREITPRTASLPRHRSDINGHIADFFQRHFEVLRNSPRQGFKQ